MRRLILAVLMLASAGAAAESHPLSMWQLNGASNRIYLLGSVHLLRERDYPIPSTIYTAYRDADTLIMELDMDDLDPAVTQALVSELGLIEDGRTLMDVMGDELYADVVDGYFARHRVKPGITGWAQVNGWRGETDTSEKIHRRVEHDLFYIENWSVFFDLAILFKTPFALFQTKNAY